VGSRKVLIGEDRRNTRELLAAAFEAAGYAVDSVQNGPEVLEKAILERPDIILLKLFLGNMQGDAVAGMVLNMPKTSGIPVVLYDGSGVQVPDARFADPALGIRRFVHSEDAEALTTAVREVLSA
jgi:CheY-like chemotaxis protein